MRKFLTALSFAALTIAGSGMASAQGDFRTSDVRAAGSGTVHLHLQAATPVQQLDTGDRMGNDILINHPEPRGAGNSF